MAAISNQSQTEPCQVTWPRSDVIYLKTMNRQETPHQVTDSKSRLENERSTVAIAQISIGRPATVAPMSQP